MSGWQLRPTRGTPYAMAKRLQLNFDRPGPSSVEENGQPRPCAMGVGWVNAHTMETIEALKIPRTDAKGNPLVVTASAATDDG